MVKEWKNGEITFCFAEISHKTIADLKKWDTHSKIFFKYDPWAKKFGHPSHSIQFNYLLQILKLHMVLFTLEMNIHTVW